MISVISSIVLSVLFQSSNHHSDYSHLSDACRFDTYHASEHSTLALSPPFLVITRTSLGLRKNAIPWISLSALYGYHGSWWLSWAQIYFYLVNHNLQCSVQNHALPSLVWSRGCPLWYPMHRNIPLSRPFLHDYSPLSARVSVCMPMCPWGRRWLSRAYWQYAPFLFPPSCPDPLLISPTISLCVTGKRVLGLERNGTPIGGANTGKVRESSGQFRSGGRRVKTLDSRVRCKLFLIA